MSGYDREAEDREAEEWEARICAELGVPSLAEAEREERRLDRRIDRIVADARPYAPGRDSGYREFVARRDQIRMTAGAYLRPWTREDVLALGRSGQGNGDA